MQVNTVWLSDKALVNTVIDVLLQAVNLDDTQVSQISTFALLVGWSHYPRLQLA